MKTYHALLTILLVSHTVAAQSFYGLQVPIEDLDKKCSKCVSTFKSTPKEVHFGVIQEGANIYFEITHREWLDKILKGSKDGIMIDIVSKERYNCKQSELKKDNFKVIGKPQRPVYSKQIKKGLKQLPNGRYRTKIGVIPVSLRDKELEFNLFFFNNNNLCLYYRIYNLQSYGLDLLDMGMYMDVLTYLQDIRKPSLKEKEGFRLKYKTLKFKVPFEKNKATYSAMDIKPVYDSLHLTDYDIKTIYIQAYSSVEGSLKRNIELQEERAASIASALQEFQKPTIKTEINATENWVEFFRDIEETRFSNYSSFNQEEIKVKLTDPNINATLEPYLKNHRKALITLSLQKKDTYKTKASKELFGLYTKALGALDIEEALKIQNLIFERIKGNEVSPNQINKLSVPRKKEYVDLAINNTVMKYMMNERQVLRTFVQLKRLDKIVPDNKRIKYNICAAKFKIWKYRIEPIDASVFKKEILALKNYGIKPVLIDRMLINYHMVKSEYDMAAGDFDNKDVSMKYIHEQYKKIPHTDYDYLNLAQYFSSYSNLEYAVDVLKDKVVSIDADEDLLFYYLNLTLVDKELTAQSEYRTMMLNAISKNKERFCKIFNSYINGGVTFQLLEDPNLRNTYCDQCESFSKEVPIKKGFKVTEQ